LRNCWARGRTWATAEPRSIRVAPSLAWSLLPRPPAVAALPKAWPTRPPRPKVWLTRPKVWGDKDVDGVVGVVGTGDTLGMVGTGVTEGMGDTMGMVAPGDTLGMVEPGDTLGTAGTTVDTLGVVVRKVVIGAESLGIGAAPADERACANAASGNRSQRAMAARTA
jgi:hypothetical protein